VPGEVRASEFAFKDAVAGFGWTVRAELLLVFGNVNLHRDG
jgi:hypothetical protein